VIVINEWRKIDQWLRFLEIVCNCLDNIDMQVIVINKWRKIDKTNTFKKKTLLWHDDYCNIWDKNLDLTSGRNIFHRQSLTMTILMRTIMVSHIFYNCSWNTRHRKFCLNILWQIFYTFYDSLYTTIIVSQPNMTVFQLT